MLLVVVQVLNVFQQDYLITVPMQRVLEVLLVVVQVLNVFRQDYLKTALRQYNFNIHLHIAQD